ncbi:metallophosphoesterase, partial [bacterium]|nr:metallophosphoesterase [bacterium]
MTEISRRKCLKLGASFGLGLTLNPAGSLFQFGQEKSLAFGLVTDLHFADKEARNNRYYRESLEKLDECVRTFNKHRLPLAVVLGDLVDSAASHEAEQKNLKAVTDSLFNFNGRLHFVLGNHDLRKFSKQGFLQRCGALTSGPHYSFDHHEFHFVVLDGNFKSNGQPYERGNFKWRDTIIPQEQLQWLKSDLQQSNRPTYVFCH